MPLLKLEIITRVVEYKYSFNILGCTEISSLNGESVKGEKQTKNLFDLRYIILDVGRFRPNWRVERHK